MSNYKEPQDKTAAYLSRDGKWFKMDKESVRKVCGRPRLRNTAKIAFFALQPYFHDGNGLLIEPLEHVALDLGTTKDKLSEDIDILVAAGILRRTQAGLLYDPVSYKLITRNEEPPDAKFCRFSQDSAKFGENFHSSPGQNAPLDKIRASFSDASNAASEKRSDLNSNQNEEDRKKGERSLGLPSLFPGLKLKDVEEVRHANLDLDWSELCSLFIEKNQKTDVKRVNLKWFETFVSGYRKRKGVATASPRPADPESEAIRIARLPKLECKGKWIKDKRTGKEEEIDVYTIGGTPIDKLGISEADFVKLCQTMPPKSEAEAVKYLRQLIGKEWNAKHALEHFGKEYDGWLFFFDEADAETPWCGCDWQSSQVETEKAAIS